MTITNTTLTISYVSIQFAIALIVSITGAIHIRQCTKQEKLEQSAELTTNINIENSTDNNESNMVKSEATEHELQQISDNTQEEIEEKTQKQKGFCELWIKTTWRMRGVYGGLAVHSFDVLTDILVILQWLETPDISGDNVDPKAMAYSAISILLFSKIVSSIAIYLKEGDIIRSILQFFDLLIFQEIFESHRKIVSQIKNKKIKKKNNSIESTLSFKYIRSMEAIFESIPQSVLQLVYVMRTSTSSIDSEAIFIVSILQSMVSMTNSILNNDYTRMQQDKWNKYKQRLPPTFAFLKHALSRLSEIAYRIGLLALFWTVCGGLAFCIMIGIEICAICIRMAIFWKFKDEKISAESILLGINSLILIPSEKVYGGIHSELSHWIEWNKWCTTRSNIEKCIFRTVTCCCCCSGLCAVFISLPMILCKRCLKNMNKQISWIVLFRIGISFAELILLIIWAFYAEQGQRKKFLFDAEHGLAIFVSTCIFFIIYSQYNALFPNFSLPHNVSIRSKWGYAFSNELTELKKIKLPFNRMPYWSKYDDSAEIRNEADFWDEPCNKHHSATAAVFALAQENYHIIEWLEQRGAVNHIGIDRTNALKMLRLKKE